MTHKKLQVLLNRVATALQSAEHYKPAELRELASEVKNAAKSMKRPVALVIHQADSPGEAAGVTQVVLTQENLIPENLEELASEKSQFVEVFVVSQCDSTKAIQAILNKCH